jgi:Lrp/AsnC family transcriptional regulator for asnA, asnC and gidA
MLVQVKLNDIAKEDLVELDEINLAIINHLRDGRMPYKKIADSLALSEGTIRARVKKLRQEGVLDITALVNPEATPEQSVIMVGVRLKDMDLVKKAEEFSRLRGVISVCVVTGRFDLILTVMLSRDFPMVRFYTEEVAKLDNIRAVETFVVYKSFNLKVPLTLGG